ncbi:DUF6777 domain-containing protein, partial [Streptomyces sp. NPDC020807]|uniref:DUF6777 domain-containing protein n=1 Tax=Streptomyces sp. NPDC020807 TaxID=3155119 RepID=UPI0034008685
PPSGGGGGGGGGSGGGGGGSPGGPGGGSPGGPAGDGSGGGSPKGGGPWWRSVPKVASATAVLVAGVALAVVLTNQPGDKGDTSGSGGGEVFLQNASASGPDPFTQSTARTDGGSASPASLPPRSSSAEAGTPKVSGAAPGLYGGTQNVASCNVEQQVRFLAAEPARNAAFASVLSIKPDQVPGYLRSLTPLQLRVDTRVTNHGFKDGAATTYQAVLQSGTAVLVDERGMPRVRCACGNPLTEAVAQKAPRTSGTPWQGYDSSQLVVVAPSVTVVNVFVVYDPQDDDWFARKHGDHGRHDKPTPPPPPPPTRSTSPSVSPSTSLSPSPSESTLSPIPCVTVTGTETPEARNGITPSPCPSTLSPTPSTSTPSTDSSSPSTDSSSPSSPSDSTSPSDESPSTDSSEPSPQSLAPESGPATDGSSSAAGTESQPAPRSASPLSPSPLSPTLTLSTSPTPTGTATTSSSAPAPGPGPGGAAVA